MTKFARSDSFFPGDANCATGRSFPGRFTCLVIGKTPCSVPLCITLAERLPEIFFGTPHRDRTQSLWRGTIYDLFANADLQVRSRDAAGILTDISQALEFIPGIFGTCNGFKDRGVCFLMYRLMSDSLTETFQSVSPYAATLGLPVTLERNFSWPTDMSSRAANELQNRLWQEIYGSSGLSPLHYAVPTWR